MQTITTTCTTTTTTTTVAGSPIMSATASIGGNPYGLNYSQHHLGATALPLGNIDATMEKLEFEVKFAREELEEEFDNTIADLEDEGHEEVTRKRKKASVLVSMMGEEKRRDAYEHTLTYVCGTADAERRKAVKRYKKADEPNK